MAQVMDQLNRLDGAIEKRMLIEDAFIQAMVAEFRTIATELTRCNARAEEAARDLAAANQAATNGNPDAAQAVARAEAETAAARRQLEVISGRLQAATRRLETGAPLNQVSLPKVINEVIGREEYGNGRRDVPNGRRYIDDERFGAPAVANGAANGAVANGAANGAVANGAANGAVANGAAGEGRVRAAVRAIEGRNGSQSGGWRTRRKRSNRSTRHRQEKKVNTKKTNKST